MCVTDWFRLGWEVVAGVFRRRRQRSAASREGENGECAGGVALWYGWDRGGWLWGCGMIGRFGVLCLAALGLLRLCLVLWGCWSLILWFSIVVLVTVALALVVEAWERWVEEPPIVSGGIVVIALAWRSYNPAQEMQVTISLWPLSSTFSVPHISSQDGRVIRPVPSSNLRCMWLYLYLIPSPRHVAVAPS